MATLNEVMKDTADAIREKTGKSELIAPVNFAEEIKSISAGGGESGGIEYEYFAATDREIKKLDFLASLVKAETPLSGIVVFPPVFAQDFSETPIVPLAVAFDMSLILKTAELQMTLKDFLLKDMGVTEEILAKYRLTKEQFYDLNA